MTSALPDLPIAEILTFLRGQVPKVAAHDPLFMAHYLRAIDDYESGFNPHELPLMLALKRYPVGVEEFMFGAQYLNRPRSEIYPEVLNELVRINNPGGYHLTNPYVEVVFTGGIGSAKTTAALYTIAYQLYVLSCFSDPHGTFGMDSTSEILFIFQSLNGEHAQILDYGRFRKICEQSHYFTTTWPFDPRTKKILKFPSRIEVKSIGGDTGTIGQNVIGGMIDELNFMAITQNSKRTMDKGEYNQALAIYNGISRRRKSRFVSQGRMPGILCLVSSKRYPGEFTDKKIEEAKTDSSIYIYDKRVWDVKPAGTFTKGWFRVFVGDVTRKAHIILDTGWMPPEGEAHLVVEVPEDFRQDFEDDIIGSLRDIAGVGTLARYPFMLNVSKVNQAFGMHKNVFSLQETDFVTSKLQLMIKHMENPEVPRWAHVDLGVTGDAAGLAIGHCPGFKSMLRTSDGGGEGQKELMPIIKFDGLLRIKPPKDDEILFYKVRDILYLLRDRGMNIKWVTFDSFQSVDSIQLLKQRGFIAGRQSIDITNTPYEMTKTAFYDGRIELPEHTHCQHEFLSLEKDDKTGKVDHPAYSSKDVADAVAGVVHGITMRRETWALYGVPIHNFLARTQTPEGLTQ